MLGQNPTPEGVAATPLRLCLGKPWHGCVVAAGLPLGSFEKVAGQTNGQPGMLYGISPAVQRYATLCSYQASV